MHCFYWRTTIGGASNLFEMCRNRNSKIFNTESTEKYENKIFSTWEPMLALCRITLLTFSVAL
jgi:hypothetical protein